ncbi:hypothetical protein CDAR_226211 [Caerostris darwini]|uniref:Uncharacterized protein n=1 Tax=Caerostris darwini TaxID=1538125 RepID=A0AAV4ULF8_9ARAC|nr:hypothetical protein CDAR_226211 [Caerostris darwini]
MDRYWNVNRMRMMMPFVVMLGQHLGDETSHKNLAKATATALIPMMGANKCSGKQANQAQNNDFLAGQHFLRNLKRQTPHLNNEIYNFKYDRFRAKA